MVTKSIQTFAVIGTGFIMPRHIEAINAIGGKIIDVINTSYGEYLYEDTIKRTSASYVVVLTSNHFHKPITLCALKEGKTILCEKPLGISTIEVQNIIDSERQSKGKVFTVLQLRHHPLVKKLREEIVEGKDYEVEIDISVFRDKHYYSGWKGDEKKSGGVLFNLGSHYFDLLTYLFDVPKDIISVDGNDKTMTGILEGKNFLCRWRISTEAQQNDQKRIFRFNGEMCNFSSKNNLSYENLHYYVYEDLINSRGVTPLDVLPSTHLIENIYKTFKGGNKS